MNSTRTITFDDKLGSRSIEHLNLILISGEGIVQFVGNDIPPILRVNKRDYHKNGKWSNNIWTVELFNGCEPLIWYQDWGTGFWFVSKTWKSAITEFSEKLPVGHGLTDDIIVRTIRAIFPSISVNFDKADKEWKQNTNLVADILKAQEEFAAAQEAEKEIMATIEQMEDLEKIKIETDKIHTRVVAAKALMKKGPVSLADLKAIMSI